MAVQYSHYLPGYVSAICDHWIYYAFFFITRQVGFHNISNTDLSWASWNRLCGSPLSALGQLRIKIGNLTLVTKNSF